MRILPFSLLLTAAVAGLTAAYLAVSAYSCSSLLDGDVGNCLALAGGDVLRSGAAPAAALGCAALTVFSVLRRRIG